MHVNCTTPAKGTTERESVEGQARVGATAPISLVWRSAGLLLVREDGALQAVSARRCFPWSDPGHYISLRDAADNEIALLEDLAGLDAGSREAVARALAEASFVMEIERLDSVEEEFEIRNWKVTTRQGARTFQTRRDEWPRRTPDGAFLIADVAGDLYRIADPDALDAASRRRLWAFAG